MGYAAEAATVAEAHPIDKLGKREAAREAGWFLRTSYPGQVVPGSGEFTVRRRAHNRAHVLIIFQVYDDPCAWEARIGVREKPVSYRFRWLERPNVWECT
jgi:hypothetical protein